VSPRNFPRRFVDAAYSRPTSAERGCDETAMAREAGQSVCSPMSPENARAIYGFV
jgi:hypothetical protein